MLAEHLTEEEQNDVLAAAIAASEFDWAELIRATLEDLSNDTNNLS